MSHTGQGGAPAVPPVPVVPQAGEKDVGGCCIVISKRGPGQKRETPQHSHSWIWKMGDEQLSGLMRGRDEEGKEKVVHACNLCLPLGSPDPPMSEWKVRGRCVDLVLMFGQMARAGCVPLSERRYEIL